MFDLKKIESTLQSEPKFRLKQAQKLIWVDLIKNWDEATVFPKNLRSKLNQVCPLEIFAREFFSLDKETTKAIIRLSDGLEIETVLMKHRDGRNTVCVSSQVGCPLGCGFCATGGLGFTRNLKASEILEQVLFFARELRQKNQRVSNVVFMGMGEPFLNYDEVLKAIRLLNDPEVLNIGARNISVSTAGITEGIRKFSTEGLQVNLAISLHAPNNVLRQKLMPITKKYPLQKIFSAVDEYIEITNRRVMFEYVLIDRVNDSRREAEELMKLFRRKPLYFLNLIVYNPTKMFKPSPKMRVLKFKEALEKSGLKVTLRHHFGGEINAACGQLGRKKSSSAIRK